MKIGISSSCFYPLETEKAFGLLASRGVEVAEIFFNAYCELEKDFIDKLKSIQRNTGIKVSSIHPTMSLAESFMLFSGYERRYNEGLCQYKRYAEIAAELSADFIIMHGGKPNNVLDNKGYFERFYKISQAVKENGAVLLQENVVNYRAGNLEVLKEMAEYLGDEVGFCLDVKQSIRGGYSPFDVIENVGKNVKHIHISDNTKDNDCLLPLRGAFDFKAFFSRFEELGYKGSAIIEVYRNAYNDYNEIFDSYKNIK